MKNIKILQYTILIISFISLSFAIYFISPSITYAIDYNEEANLLERANDYLSEGEVEYALQIYDEILKLNQTNISALNYKGLALASLGNYEEAIKMYNKVLTIDPDDIDAKHNKRLALLSLNKTQEANILYDQLFITKDESNYLSNLYIKK